MKEYLSANEERSRCDVQSIMQILHEYDDEWDRLNIVSRVAAALCPDFTESEVQQFLCGIALEMEIAAGRALPTDSSWVSISIRRDDQ